MDIYRMQMKMTAAGLLVQSSSDAPAIGMLGTPSIKLAALKTMQEQICAIKARIPEGSTDIHRFVTDDIAEYLEQ